MSYSSGLPARRGETSGIRALVLQAVFLLLFGVLALLLRDEIAEHLFSIYSVGVQLLKVPEKLRLQVYSTAPISPIKKLGHESVLF
jgi:hypothetical protein